MNNELLRPFQALEVHEALNQMESSSAPSPDGLPPMFYKQYWSKVGTKVSTSVLSILNLGILPPDLNHIFITLIPKIKSPRNVTDFHPISLINVLYKLITKVLANCVKKFLPQLISETQSAFLSDTLIIDNILIAHETLHYLKVRRQGKMGLMVLKLDMSKAYDWVEWEYLEKIISKMGFSQR